VSRDNAADPLHFVYFTTKLGFYSNGRLEGEIIRLAPGDYPFITVPSVLPFLELEEFSRSILRGKYQEGLLKHKGKLSAGHVAELVRKARSSVLMERRFRRIICPDGMAPPNLGVTD